MRFSNDPRWIEAKFDSKDITGNPVKRGDRVFYYPLTKTLLSGEEAERASRNFEADRYRRGREDGF